MIGLVISAIVTTGVAVVTTAASVAIHVTWLTVRMGYGYLRRRSEPVPVPVSCPLDMTTPLLESVPAPVSAPPPPPPPPRSEEELD